MLIYVFCGEHSLRLLRPVDEKPFLVHFSRQGTTFSDARVYKVKATLLASLMACEIQDIQSSCTKLALMSGDEALQPLLRRLLMTYSLCDDGAAKQPGIARAPPGLSSFPMIRVLRLQEEQANAENSGDTGKRKIACLQKSSRKVDG